MPDGGPGGRGADPGAERGAGRQRVVNAPAYVLHTRPWKETSLIADLLTRGHGRIVAVAKGARRPGSQLRPVLMPFQPLLVSWSGKSEVRVLHSAEWTGGVPLLVGIALMCGFYLNELLVRALARDDPHDGLYDAYDRTVSELATAEFRQEILRRFEVRLLAELGYGLQLGTDAGGEAAVQAGRLYRYLAERGPVLLAEGEAPDAATVTGKTLLDMVRDEYADPVTAAESKRLMRMLLQHHLGMQVLHARQLVAELPSPGAETVEAA